MLSSHLWCKNHALNATSRDKQMDTPLDRKQQLDILEKLAFHYPSKHRMEVDSEPLDPEREDKKYSLLYNIAYLGEHKLVDCEIDLYAGVMATGIPLAKITSKGLDFLKDDGGLSAILGVVTVKLHDDTIRDLLERKIDADPTSDTSTKTELKKAVRKMPAQMLKTVTTKALEAGIGQIPNLTQWLHHVIAAAT